MKPTFKLLLVLSLFTSMFTLSSCGKDDDDKGQNEDPCNSTVTVTATERVMHNLGHFILDQNDGSGFTVGQTFLYATNWSDYAHQVSRLKKYQIAYKEVPCTDRDFENTTFNDDNRCGTPIFKCIEILCLKEMPTQDCFQSSVLTDALEPYYSRAIAYSYIENHSLKTTSYFSGCSQKDDVKFQLMLHELPTMGPLNQPMFEAKVVEQSNNMTCQAVFQKYTCFDLSSIRQYFEKNGRSVPSEVLINLYEGDHVNQLTYQP